MAKGETVQITMRGGPKDGQVYPYGTRLPRELVFQGLPQGEAVYFRKPDSREYVYADDIPDMKVYNTIGVDW